MTPGLRRATPLAAALALGCVGTDVGNPTALKMAFLTYDAKPAGGLTLATGIRVERALVAVERLRLRESARCDDAADRRVDVVGPLALDLLASAPIPLDVALTSYCRFELAFARLDPGRLPGAPAELQGRSVFIRGARADGTAFELGADFSDALRFDAKSTPFQVQSGGDALVVAFAANEWLRASELDAADVTVRSGERVVLIDTDHNRALLDAFRDTVKRSARLFRDADKDGELDEEEKREEDALARGEEEDD